MKKILFIVFVLLLNVNGFSQRFITKAPVRAQAMLDSLYHGAKDVWWYTDTNATEVNYYAYFIYNSDEIKLAFVWHPQQKKMELKVNEVSSTGLANVPPAIIHKFDSIFPNALHVLWRKPIYISDSERCSVEFSLYRTGDYGGDFTEMRDFAEFDWHGKLTWAYLITPDSLLPAKLKAYLHAHYPDYKLSDWTIVGDVGNSGNIKLACILHKNQNFIDNITGTVRIVIESFDLEGNSLKKHHYYRSAGITDPF